VDDWATSMGMLLLQSRACQARDHALQENAQRTLSLVHGLPRGSTRRGYLVITGMGNIVKWVFTWEERQIACIVE